MKSAAQSYSTAIERYNGSRNVASVRNNNSLYWTGRDRYEAALSTWNDVYDGKGAFDGLAHLLMRPQHPRSR